MDMISINFPGNYYTDSAIETENIGRLLAAKIACDRSLPMFIAMYGDLGVGKTAFVRGFCSELCPNATVKSPTFALVNEYKCIANECKIKKIYHFDMYRIVDEDDLYSIGFYDYLRNDALCVAEWCEMIPYALPEKYVKVDISKVDLENKRAISISIVGD